MSYLQIAPTVVTGPDRCSVTARSLTPVLPPANSSLITPHLMRFSMHMHDRAARRCRKHLLSRRRRSSHRRSVRSLGCNRPPEQVCRI